MRAKAVLLSLLVLVGVLAPWPSALAGIEPVPWHVVIANRTDRLDAASPFSNQSMGEMQLTLYVSTGSDNLGASPVEIPIALGGVVLGPGEAIAVPIDARTVPGAAGGSVLSWSFSVKMGVEPMPWYGAMGVEPSPWYWAFERVPTVRPSDDYRPTLTPSYLTPEMPIVGFASPGVILGTVAIIDDGSFYTDCPSIPVDRAPWKNHGQYVRCIAHRAEVLTSGGQITAEEADAIVSAAGQSSTGK